MVDRSAAARKAWKTRRKRSKMYNVVYRYKENGKTKLRTETVDASSAREARREVARMLQKIPLKGAVVKAFPK